MTGTTRAFRVESPGRASIVEVPLPDPGPDDVVVRTLSSAVSRGTETLVFRGEVPPSQYERMRAPFQTGDFPGPVIYGYLAVGVVEQGPGAGRTVFCLHPHQERFVVPASMVVRMNNASNMIAKWYQYASNVLIPGRPLNTRAMPTASDTPPPHAPRAARRTRSS